MKNTSFSEFQPSPPFPAAKINFQVLIRVMKMCLKVGGQYQLKPQKPEERLDNVSWYWGQGLSPLWNFIPHSFIVRSKIKLCQVERNYAKVLPLYDNMETTTSYFSGYSTGNPAQGRSVIHPASFKKKPSKNQSHFSHRENFLNRDVKTSCCCQGFSWDCLPWHNKTSSRGFAPTPLGRSQFWHETKHQRGETYTVSPFCSKYIFHGKTVFLQN